MAAIATETIENVLWITGNVDRKGEQDLTDAVEDYVKKLGDQEPVVDMSTVGYFATGSAKALILVAQDVKALGQKLTVRASRQVGQTFQMLGAQSWMNVEICKKPNVKPETEAEEMDLELPPDDLEIPTDRPSNSGITPAKSIEKTDDYTPSVHIPKGAKRKGATKSAGGSSAGADPGIRKGLKKVEREKSAEDLAVERAQDHVGEPLVPEDDELSEDLAIMKKMRILGTYTFHMGGEDLTAKLVERVIGPWIMVDARGTKRWLNLNRINYIDVL